MTENSSGATESRSASGFLKFELNPRVQRGIDAAGYIDPRPIQAETIPAVLNGDDVLGLAQTGTGKTAAFVAPILDYLLEDDIAGPRALILAPTRELAIQIQADIDILGKFTGLNSMTIYGGVKQEGQVRKLRAEPDIIVACPGRLIDLYDQGLVDFSGIEILVLDEADHMFDIGFLPSIRKIISNLPKDRQNLMFSATMPREIRGLADQILVKPHVVELEHSKPAETISHAVYSVAAPRKTQLLEYLLAQEDFKSGIVFCAMKFRAKRLAEQLNRAGHNSVCLQGNMTQGQRDRAMSGFRDGRYAVLVATDVAARGIDVDHVSHVINYDIPQIPDSYTHRIGRTGRAEREGTAYTFVGAADYGALKAIERKIDQKIERRGLPTDVEMAEAAEKVREAAKSRPAPEPIDADDAPRARGRGRTRPRSSAGGSGQGRARGPARRRRR